MRVNGETSTGNDPRGKGRVRAGAAVAPEDAARALEVVCTRAPALASMPGLGWTDEDSSLAGAAAFFTKRPAVGPVATGIVGGASSGKSTLFNHLVGGGGGAGGRGVPHTSLVTMRAHTTRGPVAAAEAEGAGLFRDWVERECWGGPGAARRFEVAVVPVDSRTTGEERRMTLAALDDAAMPGQVLVDTPDLTSLDAKDSGDITRAMLAWFDRVIVVVDEDRWFDDQLFGWLARRLDDVIPVAERLVVFNRTQRSAEDGGGTDDKAGRSMLAERARALGAACVFLEYQPGRGLVRLDAAENVAALREVKEWLGRATAEPGTERARRLLGVLSGRAAAVLRENSRRLELLSRLGASLEAELGVWERSDKRIAFEVLLTAAQHRQLDPIWQSVVRPLVWARESGTAVLTGRALLGRGKRKPSGEESDPPDGTIAQRGTRYFGDQLARSAACLRSAALLSELWAHPGTRGALGGVDEVVATGQERGAALSQRCGEAFAAFAERFEEQARAVKVGALSSGAAVIGAIIGGLITLPAGGFGVPAGAAMGAAIGATASLSGARSLYRLARLLVGTPELKALWASIGEFRVGLRNAQGAVREAILDAGSASVIQPHDPLYGALDRLRAMHTAPVRPSGRVA